MYLLGLDVGTSGCKVIVFDYKGELVSSAYREYSEYSPQAGWTELDPNEVWLKVKDSIRECITGRIPPGDIDGMSISVMGEAVFPIDRRGNVLYPAITPYDARGTGYRKLLLWWERKFGAMELFRTTGIPLSSMPSVNKILWIRQNMPNIFRRAWKFVCFEDYLIWKLTGEAATDYSMACRMMILDMRKKRWSCEILRATDLDEDLLAKVHSSGTVVGEVHTEASNETGLEVGMPVATGGHDQACGALGAGVIDEGPTIDATGSVECIASATRKPILTRKMLEAGQCSHCHTVKDMYISLGFLPSAGLVFRWYRDVFAEREREEARRAGKNVYDVLTGIAAGSPEGASGLLLLPHFSGSSTGQSPPLSRNSKGALVGLSLFHKKADIIRSILEGITFELRQMIEHFEDAGIEVSNLRAIGGGARSPFWLQLKADITRKPVVVPKVTEAPCLGASILAGIGVKAFKGFHDAIDKVYSEKTVYRPMIEVHRHYSKRYSIYKEIYPSLSQILDKLSRCSYASEGEEERGGCNVVSKHD